LIRRSLWTAATLLAATPFANAAVLPSLSDADLIAFAQKFHTRDWPETPDDGVIGRHHGFKVMVGKWCAGDDGCFVNYVIHYDVRPGADCITVGGHDADAQTYGTVVVMTDRFCVPRVLYDQSLYARHPSDMN